MLKQALRGVLKLVPLTRGTRSPAPPTVVAVLDTYPSLSETFLYQTLQALEEGGFRLVLLARKQGASDLHGATAWKKASYLPSQSAPTLWKLLRLGGHLGSDVTKIGPARLARFIARQWKSSGELRETLRRLSLGLPLIRELGDVYYFPFGGIASKYASFFRAWDGPIVFSVRGHDLLVDPLLSQSYRDSLGTVARLAACIHCVSHSIRLRLEEISPGSSSRAVVIHTGVDEKRILAAPRAPRRVGGASDSEVADFRIISIGRLHWRKGYEHGLVAMRELVRRRELRCRWEILGEGPHRPALEWAIRDMGLEGVVELAGPVASTQISARLDSADVFFHPALAEGLSNAVLEAMARGLPVVVTNVPGMEEAVREEREGLLVARRDWRGMADALERLARDPALRSSLGEQARMRVLAEFTLGRHQRKFCSLFKRVVGESESRTCASHS